ncbi:hypothetical protein BG95_08585 [Thermosipho sp. 1063]|uniref:hypothetical protein n=1 Tax=unclassified Thermosipho (in: thermotogales) TaxID=2676525 RepID=UPI0009492D85|nr:MULTISPECIES: hypothetical protein [unclassified Thermosipho (in: thermotogales)]ANQ54676.1 hypothetical protein Y592_08690 [Thermosipho sp. 1070]APT73070.1 hypothetical protein BG95_08585 [Thermosipho sp. 1063]OOC42331.1 hypothetical protein XO08_08650 [Thermosipho sp. 1074]
MDTKNNIFIKLKTWLIKEYVEINIIPIFAIILSIFDMYLLLSKANIPPLSDTGDFRWGFKLCWIVILSFPSIAILNFLSNIIFKTCKREKISKVKVKGWWVSFYFEYVNITIVLWSVILYIFYGNRDVLNKGLKWIIIYLLILVLVHPLNKKNIIFVMMKNKKRRYF